MKNTSIDMTEGKLLPKIIRFSIPVMLVGLLQMLYNAADLAVVGRFGSYLSVGAVGSTSSLSWLFINLFMGISAGAGVLLAHARGEKNDEKMSRVVHTAYPVALISGVIVTVAGIIFSKPMLRLMNSPEGIIDLAALYLRIYFAGILAMIVYNFGASLLRAVGDTKHPLMFLVISGSANLVMNLFFVIVLHMDVAGVALATSLSNLISAVLVTITLAKRKDACRLCFNKLKIHKQELLGMLRIGLPTGLENSMFSISVVIIQSTVNSFGEAAVAGAAAAANAEHLVGVICDGITMATVNFVGQNMGAKKYGRVSEVVRLSVICSAVLAIVLGVGLSMFGRQVMSVFIKDSPESVDVGILRLKLLSIPFFLYSLLKVFAAAMRGMGKSFIPMAASLAGVCLLRVVWVYTAVRAFHTLFCLYLSYPVSWAITLAAQVIAYLIIRKKVLGSDNQKEATD